MHGLCRRRLKPDRNMMMNVATIPTKAGCAAAAESAPLQPEHVQPRVVGLILAR